MIHPLNKIKFTIINLFVGGLSSWSPIRYCLLQKWRWALILKILLNPTSGRDASHSFLISLWPKDVYHYYNQRLIRHEWESSRHFRKAQYLIGGRDESPPTYSLKKIFNIFLSTIYKTIIYLFKNSKNFGVQTVINFSLIDPYCLKTYSYLLMLIKYHIYFLSIYIYIYIYHICCDGAVLLFESIRRWKLFTRYWCRRGQWLLKKILNVKPNLFVHRLKEFS